MYTHAESIKGVTKNVAIKLLRATIAGRIDALNDYGINLTYTELYRGVDAIAQEYFGVINPILSEPISIAQQNLITGELKIYAKDFYNVV